MAEKSREGRRLGRGLAALLGEGSAAAGPEQTTTAPGAAPEGAGAAYRELPVTAIRPNPDQPRAHIEPAALAALVASIRSSGLLQPVVVQPAPGGDGYELIAGERRWRAALEAGLERIPALVRRADARERLELALVENLVREDLSAIEVAQACACLVEDFGQSQASVADRLGRSRPAISNLLRLLELPEPVQQLIQAGSLSEGHGRAILMADGAGARRRLADQVLAEDLSVRATEAAARGVDRPRARRGGAAAGDLADAAVEAFGDAFDVPVRVRRRAGGRLVVELGFRDEAALAAALERLSG